MSQVLQKLTYKHKAALRALALGRGVEEAAREAGLSRWTLQRAKRSPAGRSYLAECDAKLQERLADSFVLRYMFSSPFMRDLAAQVTSQD